MPKKNKLNARRRCASISLSLLHTQGVQTLTPQKRKTNPIPAHHVSNHPARTSKKNETNPISASHPANLAGRRSVPARRGTQSAPRRTPLEDQKMQNEPNLPPRQLRIAPFSAKRTQFPNTRCPTNPYFRKTNPIAAAKQYLQ